MRKLENKKLRALVFNKYGGKCAYCGSDLNESFAIDHIVPISRGYSNKELLRLGKERGTDTIDNYNPCCYSCNSSKSNLDLEVWRSELSKKYDRLLKHSSTFSLLNRFKLCIRANSEIKFYFEKIKT